MKDDWTVLYCDTIEDMEALILDKAFVWPLIMSGIRDLLKSGRSSIVILEGKMTSKGSNAASVWITMSDDDVESSLNKVLGWRESREEYEECAQIVSLLNDWQLRKCIDDDGSKIADSLL
jgi:hypothetical protein